MESGTNEFYYTSNEESPMRQAVYKIDRKGKKVKLEQSARNQQPDLQQFDEIFYEQVYQPRYSDADYTE